MNIIAVDDERRALRTLREALEEAAGDADIAVFSSPAEALDYAKSRRVDVAFLDIKMPELNGLALAKRLKEISSRTNIIFVTGYSEYAGSAFELYASGYVMKPIDPRLVRRELDNLRTPVEESGRDIRVQCFGNFEIFVGGEPVSFGRAKSKELLAYLVDRHGTGATNKELAAVLWEDKAYDRNRQKQLDTVIVEMLRSLEAVGARHIIVKSRGSYAVDPSAFACDLYLFEKGDTDAANSYNGNYMDRYSWAEITAGRLTNQTNRPT